MRSVAVISFTCYLTASVHANGVLANPANPFLRNKITDYFPSLLKKPANPFHRSDLEKQFSRKFPEQQQLVELEHLLSEQETLWYRANADVAYIRRLRVGSPRSDKVPEVKAPQVAGKISLAKLAEVLEKTQKIRSLARADVVAIRKQLEEKGQDHQLLAQIQKLTWVASTEVMEMEELVDSIKQVKRKAERIQEAASSGANPTAYGTTNDEVEFHPLRPASFLTKMHPRSIDFDASRPMSSLSEMPSGAKGNLLSIVSIPGWIGATLSSIFVGSVFILGMLRWFPHGSPIDSAEPLLTAYS